MWRIIGLSLLFILPSLSALFKAGGYYTRKDKWATEWTELSIAYCVHSITCLLAFTFTFIVGVINNSVIVVLYPIIFTILGLPTFLSMNSDICAKDRINEYIENLKEKE